MLSSAATFGFFLAIGSVSTTIRSAHSQLIPHPFQVIRSDSSLLPPHLEAAHIQLMQSASRIRSKNEGFQLMRTRWQAERQRLEKSAEN